MVLLGENGNGKTTLVRLLLGELEARYVSTFSTKLICNSVLSKQTFKFKKDFKMLEAEQRHEIVLALSKVHHEDTKREAMKTIIRANHEQRKEEGRGLTLRQQQIAKRLASTQGQAEG